MRILRFILTVIVDVFFTSATPHLFGSRKRRLEKQELARKMEGYADGIQEEIDVVKAQDPFESAAAKAAMANATRQARQQATRFANVMGARGATPEAMVAAQQATQEGIGAAAGQIATGAEAMKKQELGQLRGQQAAMRSQYGQIKQSAIGERGAGWRDMFSILNPLAGGMQGAMSAASQ